MIAQIPTIAQFVPSLEKTANFKGKLVLRTGEYDVVIYLTTYAVFLQPDKEIRTSRPDMFTLPWTAISSLKYKTNDQQWIDKESRVKIKMKSRCVYTLQFGEKESLYLVSIVKNLKSCMDHYSLASSLFCYELKTRLKEVELKHNGWGIFDIKKDCGVQGLDLTAEETLFRVVDNTKFKISPTYGRQFITFASLNDAFLEKVGVFRSKARIPILSLLYPCQHNKSGFSSLWRSSQPSTGFFSKRCLEDEYMVQLIGNPNKHFTFEEYATEKVKLMDVDAHIYDLRGKAAAFTNKFKGKGYESTQFYTNCEIFFEDIPNIHGVRDSFEAIATASYEEQARGWHSAVGRSNWYGIIGDILKTANSIRRSLTKGYGVLIHCSDGWDRTSQMSAIVELLLVPHYRTLIGFCELFEKEFVRAGFNFALRCGFEQEGDKLQESPVIIQFLDCVHQLWVQYPSEFEFNLSLLTLISFHIYSGAFGNLITRCDRERVEKNLESKTISIWSFVIENKADFSNQFFSPRKRSLHLKHKESELRVWKEFFGCLENSVKKETSHRHETDFETYLISELHRLKKENTDLKVQLGEAFLREKQLSNGKIGPHSTPNSLSDDDSIEEKHESNRKAQEFEIPDNVSDKKRPEVDPSSPNGRKRRKHSESDEEIIVDIKAKNPPRELSDMQ